MKFLFTLLTLAISPQSAFGFCSEPSAYVSFPDAPRSYVEPSVPYCLNSYSYSKKHTCNQWELDNYFSEVDDYIDELNDYISEANNAAEEALSFAQSAKSYAQCKAEEISTQHE